MRWLRNAMSAVFLRFRRKVGLPEELLRILPLRKAWELADCLKSLAQSPNDAFPRERLFNAVQAAGWEEREIQKLAAYVDFYTGQSAQAYQNVMDLRLADGDYHLFMTAVVHCYLSHRFAEGYALFKSFDVTTAVDFDPDEYHIHVGLLAYTGGGRIDESVDCFDRVKEFTPLLAINACSIYFSASRFEPLEYLRAHVYESCPENPRAIYALGWIELARSFYPEGFRLWECRYQMALLDNLSFNHHLFSHPRWSGEPLQGKVIFIHGEQGFGDLVMMARYLPLLLAEGAAVVMDLTYQAISLFEFNFPECRFLLADYKKSVPVDFDYWTASMSLPYHFKTTAETVPARQGYLRPPPEQQQYWSERIHHIKNSQLRVGVAWSGNPEHLYDQIRSIPYPLFARYLEQCPDIEFYALQTVVPESLPSRVHNCSEEMVTLADTTALMAEMDLVVTVDTSIVHLAGALGITTWLLLPYRYEWRWGLEGEQNNWYDSVRVLRQKKHGDWDSLLAEVFQKRLPAFRREHEAQRELV